jgi:cyclase
MEKWTYEKGLQEIGPGQYAYLVPDGSWGWSNAGLITDHEETLLVDTLFDLKSTQEMLDTMQAALPNLHGIDTLVNTHSNGDHTFGNELAKAGEIIASAACLAEMQERGPAELAELMRDAPTLGEGGKLLLELMGPSKFDFENIDYTLPTKTFEKELEVQVGDKKVQLINVGPAHTGGDVLAFVPEDRVVYTGDILFNYGHPVLWAGPIANWIRACDLMLSWDVDVIVPGHGPLTDKSGVQRLKDYLKYIDVEAKKCWKAGLSVEDAASEISLDPYSDWIDSERIVINVNSLYKEYGGENTIFDRIKLFELMAQYRKRNGIS